MEAKVVHSGGFFVPSESVEIAPSHCDEQGKTYCLKLGVPFIMQVPPFKTVLMTTFEGEAASHFFIVYTERCLCTPLFVGLSQWRDAFFVPCAEDRQVDMERDCSNMDNIVQICEMSVLF